MRAGVCGAPPPMIDRWGPSVVIVVVSFRGPPRPRRRRPRPLLRRHRRSLLPSSSSSIINNTFIIVTIIVCVSGPRGEGLLLGLTGTSSGCPSDPALSTCPLIRKQISPHRLTRAECNAPRGTRWSSARAQERSHRRPSTLGEHRLQGPATIPPMRARSSLVVPHTGTVHSD